MRVELARVGNKKCVSGPLFEADPAARRPRFPRGLAAACFLAVLALWPVAGPGAVKRYVPAAPEQIETELLEMVNRERELQGRGPLVQHPLLREIARSHSAKMATENLLSHYFPGWPPPMEKLRQADVYFLINAENIALSPTPDAGYIHQAFMDSFGHRINILDGRMLQAGIGVVKSGYDYYVTQEFAALIDRPDEEKAMALIEGDLRGWFKEKFGTQAASAVEARSWAKVSAQQYLRGNPISLDLFNERKMHGINICYNDMETILAELKTAKWNAAVSSLAVGVAWGRNAGFPGGTYSVSLLLFE
jgi:uncharacterized protein YkwD